MSKGIVKAAKMVKKRSFSKQTQPHWKTREGVIGPGNKKRGQRDSKRAEHRRKPLGNVFKVTKKKRVSSAS